MVYFGVAQYVFSHDKLTRPMTAPYLDRVALRRCPHNPPAPPSAPRASIRSASRRGVLPRTRPSRSSWSILSWASAAWTCGADIEGREPRHAPVGRGPRPRDRLVLLLPAGGPPADRRAQFAVAADFGLRRCARTWSARRLRWASGRMDILLLHEPPRTLVDGGCSPRRTAQRRGSCARHRAQHHQRRRRADRVEQGFACAAMP